jgi:hypothetical protein
MDLDKAYSDAADFDARQFDKWVRENFEMLTKRTDYPKLGYIISRLNDLGIGCLLHGKSFHAEHLLWVEKARFAEASAVLSEKHGKKILDEMPDDHSSFRPYANVRCESLDDWTGDPSRDPSMGDNDAPSGRYVSFKNPIALPFDAPPHGQAMVRPGDLITFIRYAHQGSDPHLEFGRVVGLVTHDEYGSKYPGPTLVVITFTDARMAEVTGTHVELEDVKSVMPSWDPLKEWFFGHKDFDARRVFMHSRYGSLTPGRIQQYLTKNGELKDISSAI